MGALKKKPKKKDPSVGLPTVLRVIEHGLDATRREIAQIPNANVREPLRDVADALSLVNTMIGEIDKRFREAGL